MKLHARGHEKGPHAGGDYCAEKPRIRTSVRAAPSLPCAIVPLSGMACSAERLAAGVAGHDGGSGRYESVAVRERAISAGSGCDRTGVSATRRRRTRCVGTGLPRLRVGCPARHVSRLELPQAAGPSSAAGVSSSSPVTTPRNSSAVRTASGRVSLPRYVRRRESAQVRATGVRAINRRESTRTMS